MRIFIIDLEYIYKYGRPEDHEEQIKYDVKINERIRILTEVGIDFTKFPDVGYIHGLMVNEQQLLELTVRKQKPEIKQEVPVPVDDESDVFGVIAKFNRIAKKLISLPGLNMAHGYNDKCEVHMPGQALATYNETLLLQDSCSDTLQSSLDQGWRIIAACPQPNQRRPDYILGRYNPLFEPTGSARRSS